MAKRIRTVNWSREEKETLLQLIRERKNVIKNKNCGHRIVKEKQQTWVEIHRLFKAEHGEGRDVNKLKEQWKRMKLTSKKSVCEIRKYQRGTGGGPSSGCVPSQEDIMVWEMLPQQFEKDGNEFDDDAEEVDGPAIEQAAHLHSKSPTFPVQNTHPIDLGHEVIYTVIEDANEPVAEESTAMITDTGAGEGGEFGPPEEAHTSVLDEQRPPRNKNKKRKVGGHMSSYEEAIFDLNKKKIEMNMEMARKNSERLEELHKITMRNAEELHKINTRNADDLYQKQLAYMEKKNKEEISLLKIQNETAKEELELIKLKKLYWMDKTKSNKE